MKLMPMQLIPINTAAANSMTAHESNGSLSSTGQSTPIDRIPFFSSDLLWRYPPFNIPMSTTTTNHNLSSAIGPLSELRARLPRNIANDPRIWSREDVISFLRCCESEFDLPNFDMDLFQMNGKALCLLTKQDLGQRCPGAGDLIYNILQLMIRESYCLPSSPVTPHFPLTPSWCVPHTPTTLPQLCNSVALSPAPSIDSQSGSPRHLDSTTISTSVATSTPNHTTNNGSSIFHYPSLNSNHGYPNSNGASSGSNQSDSDQEDNRQEHNMRSAVKSEPPSADVSISRSVSSALHDTHLTSSPPQSPHVSSFHKNNMSFFSNVETSPSVAEPNTNGRLLWDFLQQLLNDSMQRYTNYIAWKNRDSGVFKIVDPPGLAKLWGIQKNHLSMNYDKMSRALRYYYRVNILRKVQGERHCYQFLRNPSELKSIKNISLLRQQMTASSSPTTPTTPTTPTFTSRPYNVSPPTTPNRTIIKHEPMEDCDEPTDLSISNSNQHNGSMYHHQQQHYTRENNRENSSNNNSMYNSNDKHRMELLEDSLKKENRSVDIKLEYVPLSLKENNKKMIEEHNNNNNNNNNTSMQLQLNIKNQNIIVPQDLTLTKHEINYESANTYA